jgi:Na+-translocating ferredoxin:NAD+ oxidoreductase RnfC subunit
VYSAKRQSTVFLTVAGDCIANPMNAEVSMGMTITQILERFGLSQEPTRVVCGGPMTGIAVVDTERTLVTYTTRAVLAFRENARDALYNCFGCGRCQRVCPMSLNPMYIYRFVQSSYYANLRGFDAHTCTGCGTCSYVCPSRLDVAGAATRARDYALGHFVTSDKEADELEV